MTPGDHFMYLTKFFFLLSTALAFEDEEFEHQVMKRGPRNPNTEGLFDEKLLFLSCGQMGLIQAAAGFFTYFVVN